MMFFGGMWLFWIVIIGLIVWGVISFNRHRESPSKRNPLEIARERYARGEITGEQFEQLKKDLV
ncbi:MAG: hypothetical protein A2144_03075 [Chloroflexi bacterium RBG_16_50_9]|nr:MAG: hypothetical protein A2144_03075 [Chloroflexi bacterium RBG_16_50_9]